MKVYIIPEQGSLVIGMGLDVFIWYIALNPVS